MSRRRLPTATEQLEGLVWGIFERCDITPDSEYNGEGFFEAWDLAGWRVEDIDLTKVPEMIRQLKLAEVGLHFRRLQLEALLSERICPACSGPVAGRADRRFCSTRCRVKAHRERPAD